ncbi:DUF397 domain-containing protein [Nonomuraea typhae]|uniref:DUF397 domain-containing protein n=1 Tax=Nonomuraea typhae TaxID=2603600 RepID=UPI0012FB9FA5|nr:DUF397 domain-containing protein [Nonomuraea typhae]
MNPPPAPARAAWRSRCNNGSCVEVAKHDGQIWVRGSGDADGAVLRFSRGSWTAFLARLSSGG